MDNPTIIFFSGLAILGLLFWYLATEVPRRKRAIGSFLIAGIAVLCLLALKPPKFEATNPQTGELVPTLKPGIDLAGGSAFTMEVQPRLDEDGQVVPVNPRAITQAIKTLEKRLNPDGTNDMLIQGQGTNRITVEMPGVSADEAARIKETIELTAKLELRKVHRESSTQGPSVKAGKAIVPGHEAFDYSRTNDDGEEFSEVLLLNRRIAIEGKHVKFASPDQIQKGVVNIRLSSEGGKRMINLTKDMTPGVDRIAVVLDGVVMSAPVVNSVPLGSNFLIEGLDSYQEADDLSAALMNPLENALDIIEVRQVSARLGSATIHQGINAGIAGLGLTLLFVLLYYRVSGIIALLGLSVNILILFGAMAMFGFTFTLPGIAGIILTIGIAVDANVLIYERLREELKGGKSLKHAINSAYEKAFSAIFDANITTLITALILFWRASSTVKGFALTLTIGILAAMFAALVVTRVLFWWATGTDDRKEGMIKKLTFMNLIPEKTLDFMGKRKAALFLSTLAIISSLAFVGIKRDNALGIDFAGGSIIKFQIGEETISDVAVKDAIADLDLSKNPIVQEEAIPNTGNLISIRCAEVDENAIVAELRKDIPLLAQVTQVEREEGGVKTEAEIYSIEEDRDQVSAALGHEFLWNSLIALGIGLIGILTYITVRFEFSFAVGAFVALFHDLTICIGIIVISGAEFSLIHVGAILTIAGYSINDTIVVFDRIRETLRLKRGDVTDVMNIAINATLSRTLLTSVTTFMAVLVLYIFGGPALKDFSFAIMIGVIVGTYSSIFVASPIVLFWSKKRGSNLRRELLDANLEAQVNPAATAGSGE
jgi:SecD/SecF fusion protein